MPHWEDTLLDHVHIAQRLYDIGDVYIVEHEDCRAYKKLLSDGDPKDRKKEIKLHKHFADDFANKIKKNLPQLAVHKFILDLRGNVQML